MARGSLNSLSLDSLIDKEYICMEINFDLTSEFRSNVPSLVSEEKNGELMVPFSEKEIIDIIWSMEPDKDPGPDGFSFHFYRVC